ncbi:OmpW family outer membrane protein [Halomonas sp. YLGW01]|uniref:OmpW/AlkL family protein n=1 Tax=Halomonas sp. YLGW01 TaxID=2773308 RepID=UPI00177B5F35|nr:OmpW family outer membrane protein [Halomonas sp. YLGW01]
MRKATLFSAALIATTGLAATQTALAYQAGDVFVRGGIAQVEPTSDNGNVAGSELDVSDENGFTYGLGYLFSDKVGVELNGSEAFEHDLSLNGSGIGSVDRMPVNLYANYYPLGGTGGKVQPYVGVGVNYTDYSNAPSGLSIDDSWGATGQIGVDLALTDYLLLNGSVSYADVEADVSSGSTSLGTGDVDPVTIGGGITLRF